MKIIRSDTKSDEKRRLDTPLYDCNLFVRKDLTVSSAAQSYYEFVGDNSALPFSDLIDEEDAKAITEAVESGCEEPVEVFTRFYNRLDEGWRNVYVRAEDCDRTENGEPLYQVCVIDVTDTADRMLHLDKKAHKYRYYMSIKDEYYFEYFHETNQYSFYKYVNGKSVMIYSGDYDEYTEFNIKNALNPQQMRTQSEQLTRYLKGRSTSFEMIWKSNKGRDAEDAVYKLIGGVSAYNPEIVTGVITPKGDSDDMAYYLTSAGRDSFTGLLNKKACMEYSMEKLSVTDPKNVMWMIVVDIDDFKKTNDTFGHAFGDDVIKVVSDTLQKHLGKHGIVGRFGGDEFYSLIHDVPTRDDLTLLLKVISKDIMYEFDEKIKLTVSVGVSQYPKDGTDFDILFGKADKSLYIAKEKGKNRHIIYDEELHGPYSADTVGFQTVTNLMSREKRRSMLVRCISEMNVKGIDAFLKNDNLLQGLLDLFDLGGITIYGDYGNHVILRKGGYRLRAESRADIMEDEKYSARFAHETVLVLNSLNSLKSISESAYSSALEQEIGASVRTAVRKDHKPYVFVDFDVFDVSRKWSDSDVEILTVLGCMIGELIKAS